MKPYAAAFALFAFTITAAGAPGEALKDATARPAAPAVPEEPVKPAMAKSQEVPKPVKEGATVKEHKSGTWSPELNDAEKETLFAIAQDTLNWSLQGARSKFSFNKYDLTAKLKEKSATFVTFTRQGELRGCMGCLEAVEPMYLSVHTSAANASRDFRFTGDPITLDEVPKLTLHVSLLSARQKIKSVDEFKLGEHGIWMEKSGTGAVFLPEVAIEQKWTKEDTLSHLSRKAGLSGDAWKSGAEFKIFYSVVLARE